MTEPTPTAAESGASATAAAPAAPAPAPVPKAPAADAPAQVDRVLGPGARGDINDPEAVELIDERTGKPLAEKKEAQDG